MYLRGLARARVEPYPLWVGWLRALRRVPEPEMEIQIPAPADSEIARLMTEYPGQQPAGCVVTEGRVRQQVRVRRLG